MVHKVRSSQFTMKEVSDECSVTSCFIQLTVEGFVLDFVIWLKKLAKHAIVCVCACTAI